MRETQSTPPSEGLILIPAKAAALAAWQRSTALVLKAIHLVIGQVKLLISLSLGVGGLSILTLTVTFIFLGTGRQ